ncbi:RNA helicase [Ranunculus cassubicifolius]
MFPIVLLGVLALCVLIWVLEKYPLNSRATTPQTHGNSTAIVPSTYYYTLSQFQRKRIYSTQALCSSSTEPNYFCVQKKTTPTYEIPENILRLLKGNLVPDFLRIPLSPSTYKDYFAFLLYAEDYYIEKWSEFCLSNVALELRKAELHEKLGKKNFQDGKFLVSFEIDSVPERRPYLRSRDFVLVRPSGTSIEPFQGILYRVERSALVLVDFRDDFHSQHNPNRRYDVSFSFNRVCLKRCHKAIETAATNPSLLDFLFPNRIITGSYNMFLGPSYQNFKAKHEYVLNYVCRLRSAPPYLIEGPPTVISGKLSSTGILIQKMILQILRSSKSSRILMCAPINITCDVLMRSLKSEIHESTIFRANAAFREIDAVPDDILPSCSYKGECFTCPSLDELQNFKVIISTYVSSFRLISEGITPSHFTHVFMVDASSATEPETMVTLANMVGEETGVVIAGTERNFSGWVRSDIGRKYGLQKSYFQRLFEMEPYCRLSPALITRIAPSGGTR